MGTEPRQLLPPAPSWLLLRPGSPGSPPPSWDSLFPPSAYPGHCLLLHPRLSWLLPLQVRVRCVPHPKVPQGRSLGTSPHLNSPRTPLATNFEVLGAHPSQESPPTPRPAFPPASQTWRQRKKKGPWAAFVHFRTEQIKLLKLFQLRTNNHLLIPSFIYSFPTTVCPLAVTQKPAQKKKRPSFRRRQTEK